MFLLFLYLAFTLKYRKVFSPLSAASDEIPCKVKIGVSANERFISVYGNA